MGILDGIKVLDLTMAVQGPQVFAILAGCYLWEDWVRGLSGGLRHRVVMWAGVASKTDAMRGACYVEEGELCG